MDALQTAQLKTIADLPSALIDDVCFGMAELPDIFVKYGYTPESAEVFRNNDLFKRLISTRTAELEKEGLTHRVRASMVADRALMSLAQRVQDPNTPTSVLLDTYKAVAKNAGLEPKGPENMTAGAGFSVVINLGGGVSAMPTQVVDHVEVLDAQPHHPVTLNPAEFEILE